MTIPIPDGFALKANKEIEESKSFFMTYRMPVVVLSTENGMGASKAGLQEGDALSSGCHGDIFRRRLRGV